MQLCGQYGHPALAVKVSFQSRFKGIFAQFMAMWPNSQMLAKGCKNPKRNWT